jgi:2'-5' RNA ligase
LPSENRYFIAIVPPDDVSGQITACKQEVADGFGSKHALRSPPHITLFMPFLAKEKKIAAVEQELRVFAKQHSGFEIQLDGFSCFEPRVVFVRVRDATELTNCFEDIRSTMKRLGLHHPDYKNRGFHPHITIAFRDLSKPTFYQVWEHFKERPWQQTFQAAGISLLKHTGNVWEVSNHFPFSHLPAS